MQLKRTKRPFATLLVIGLALILAACNVKSDALPSSDMTDDEMVTIMWSLPDSSTKAMSPKLEKAVEENPDLTREEETALMKHLLAEQVAKLSEDELARLQQKLREDSELQD